MAILVLPAGAYRRGHPVLRLVAAISNVCGWISAALILMSIFVTCQMIVVRFVLGRSTIWQTEAVIYMMIAAATLGLSYVQKQHGHVNVDLLPLALSPSARRGLAHLVLLATIAVIGLFTWYSWESWHLAWQRNWKSHTVWGVRLWIPWAAMPIGFGLYLLQLLADYAALLLHLEEPFRQEVRR